MARAKKEVVTEVVDAPAKPKRVRKPAAPKITLKDNVLWVISRRTKLFFWQPFHAFATEDQAREFLAFYEATGEYSGRGYKVDRVELITKSLDEVFDSIENP